ncbi:hypothetical protein TNCV_907041 [Trichonephila clavipes]|nr:hypothetical protein TNCV_907041 [Trichonephila clavipes]
MWEKARRKLEKVSKVKANNKKSSKKRKKKRRVSLSSSSEEIPLDTSGDSFDGDNNDDFCAVYKGYFYTKRGPSVTGFIASNSTNGCTNIAMTIICTK